MADDTSWVLDYLGQRQPIGRSTLSGLPSESGGGTAGAPVTPVAPAPAGGQNEDAPIGGAAPQTPFSQSGPSPTQLALTGLGVANKGMNMAKLIQAMFQNGSLGSVGEDTIASLLGQQIPNEDISWLLEQFPEGADVATDFAGLGSEAAGAASEAATAAGTELAGTVSSAWAGPIFSAMKSFIDFVGEGKTPVDWILNLIDPSIMGPSKAWMTFGPRLGKTLQGTDQATTELAESLFGAQNPSAVQAALDSFRQSMGQIIPDFGRDVPAGEIPGIPGSTGSRHEGRITPVDPNITRLGLIALRDAALAGASPEDRLAAFVGAITAEQQRRQAAIAPYAVDETGASPGGAPS